MDASPRARLPGFAAGILWAVATGAAYWICGRFGLLLAIPPGYATAVWPPSGIALAAVLLGGARVAPGIWLGSILLNVPTGAGEGLSGALMIGAAIATGATLQAVVGARLIRGVCKYENLFKQDQHVISMLLLGGPVACVINTVIGVGTLWLAGKLPPDALWFTAWTWWIGDAIGVMVFTPLVLVWAVRPYSEWLAKQFFVTVPLVLLFAVVVASFVFISHREQARLRAEFDGVGRDVADSLQTNLNTTLDVLSSLEGLYASVDKIEGYQFQIFGTRLLQHVEGVQGLSWSPWVPSSARAAFEQARQREAPGYIVRELNTEGGLTPARLRAAYAPVQYIVPPDRNRRSLGFDAFAEPVRREAMEAARDSGLPVVSGKVGLVEGREAGAGIIVFMPVYQQGSQPRTVSARRKYLRGFAAAVFTVADLMKTTVALAGSHDAVVRLYDEGAGSPAGRDLYGVAAQLRPGSLTVSVPLYFAGRPWRLDVTQPPGALVARNSWQVWAVLAGGLVLTSLVGMLLLTAQGRTARVEALVTARTAELQKANSDLTGEVRVRARLENEAAHRANELAEKNLELQRRDEITRELLRNLRRSESELRRTANRLSASNRELEQFAYVTSHDLKAPLRSIASFAQLLGKRHGQQLQPEAHEFLGFISDGIRHMQELIDDLLQLSRLDSGKLDLESVPASRLVEQACKLLAADIRAAEAKVTAGTLPEVVCDARLLTQLLQNLIGNALKFQTPGQHPEVRIEVAEEPDVWHFTVADNGIGIDPRYLDQIFLIFKRLHTQDQYPGNGIGLAVCRKVMHLHGGEIWAESVPGKGTKFHFTLPRKVEALPDRAAA